MNEACCPLPACRPHAGTSARPLTADELELAELAKAIAHPARVRILQILGEHGGCLCGDLVAELDLAQSTVSQHLKQLKDAGLIQGEIDGPRVCYGIAPARLKRLKVLMAGL